MTERPKRPTIKELAVRTGLSPAAVSYALRGMQVSAETEQRVREAADELGFRYDPIARALRGGETGTVGMLVGSLSDFFHQGLVAAVQRALRAADRHVLVADADGDPTREVELAQSLADRRVDGLIAAPIGPNAEGWAQIATAVPTVAIGDALESADTVGEVLFDNDRGVQAMLRHLRELGHERVAVLSWALEQAPGRSAESAVDQWAAELGLDCRLVTCAYSLNGSRPLAHDVLEGSHRPSAIFALSDSIAYGVYVACHELGLRIPEDVSVAGYDDHPISRLLAPPLTSIDWDIEDIAATACGFLLDAMRESEGERQRAVQPPRLNARGSTGPVPTSS
jgi:DNA-binding LacI/PurR family transcriptional regulator